MRLALFLSAIRFVFGPIFGGMGGVKGGYEMDAYCLTALTPVGMFCESFGRYFAVRQVMELPVPRQACLCTAS